MTTVNVTGGGFEFARQRGLSAGLTVRKLSSFPFGEGVFDAIQHARDVHPKVFMAMESDLGKYGDLCREVNHSSLPDWFFMMIAYLDVGWGTPAVLLGAFAGWLSLELIGRFRTNQKLHQTV